MTNLTENDIEKFWIRCYLNSSTNLVAASISRAYRDLSRTIHGLKEEQNNEAMEKLKALMNVIVMEITTKSFKNQTDFDNWHKFKCVELIKLFSTLYPSVPFVVGQAQKWINMTFKYLFALGEKRIHGITLNYPFFHIPIDNIIQDKLKQIIPKFDCAWSRIIDYNKYLDYQIKVRNKYKGQIPMDIEFKLFNEQL